MENNSTLVNAELKKVLFGAGAYRSRDYYMDQAVLVDEGDYHYYVKTAENIFVMQTTNGWFQCPANEVDYKLFLELLETVPVHDNGNILEKFECFSAGSERRAVLQWVEWLFEVKLTEEDFILFS